MKSSLRALGFDPRHLLVALLGAIFAAALYTAWGLEGRWFVVVIIAVLMVSVAMATIGFLSDFVFVAFLFAIPLSGFQKWMFLSGLNEDVHTAAPYSGALGLGLMDFILVGLYLTWFARIFVTRDDPLPRFEKIDLIVVGLVLATAFSVWGTSNLLLGLSSVEHLIKHVLVYFFVSRNLKRHHLPWLLGAIAAALVIESGLGIFQNRTGLLQGIMLDKGAGGEHLNSAYEVPGIEALNRATGTCYDSHALGLYLCMLLPYAWINAFSRAVSGRIRIAWSVLFLSGAATLAVTYSRSAWISIAIAFVMIVVVMLSVWREFHMLPAAILGLWVAILASPLALQTVFSRFENAPAELLSARFEQWWVALTIWRQYPLFGVGAGNYMTSLSRLNFDWALELPVHNVFLFIAAETGLAGVLTFFGSIGAALLRFWRLWRFPHDPMARIALAAFAGLVASLVDGITNPTFREPVIYMMLWVTIGLSVALPRLSRQEREAEPV